MPRTKPRNPQRARDAYMELVQRFPLKTLKNDDDHRRASGIVSKLIGRQLDTGSGDYLDALLVLIDKYEDEHHPIDDCMTPQQAVRALMQFNGLSQADVGRIVGSESAVSMFLHGERQLSKAQIKKLADRFHVDAATFLP